jgi:hypothetical protein
MPFERKKLKQPYGETMYFIPDINDYLDEGKNFIGSLDTAEKPGTPFSQLLSYFFAFAEIVPDEYVSRKTGQTFISNTVSGKSEFLITEGVRLTNLPYHVKTIKNEIKYDDNGVEVGSKKVAVWELRNSEAYLIPNFKNPYSVLGNDGKLFYNQFTNTSLVRDDNFEGVEYFAPPVSKQDLDINSSIDIDVYNANRTLHQTMDLHTKQAIRQSSEYRTGKIREFTLMTMGEATKVDSDGNKVVIKQHDNITMVPIKFVSGWKPFYFADPVKQKEHIDKALEIDPLFIKEYKRYVLISQSNFKKPDTNPIVKEIESLTEEETRALIEEIKNRKAQQNNT